jgi:hypothetical protein
MKPSRVDEYMPVKMAVIRQHKEMKEAHDEL